LNNYLEKILQGQAINYEAFLKKLPDVLRQRHRELFSTEKAGPNRWRVTVLDEAAFEALREQAAAPVSRVDAARKGDSHRHGTEVSFLLVYHHALTGHRPDSVVIAGDSVDIGFKPASRVLVVENERNFYHYRQMLAFAGECLGRPTKLTSCDVVLGGGNRITRTADLNWLAGYDEVLCAFDYDAGGLQMFASVRSALGNKACYLQPADWQLWLSRFRKTPDATERFTKAIMLAEDLGFVSLAQAFRATGKFMEQEMILDE
tara:strand:- start:579 stop:1361 length:783 start_codon:yes stop_codon:yes gene_type:complete